VAGLLRKEDLLPHSHSGSAPSWKFFQSAQRLPCTNGSVHGMGVGPPEAMRSAVAQVGEQEVRVALELGVKLGQPLLQAGGWQHQPVARHAHVEALRAGRATGWRPTQACLISCCSWLLLWCSSGHTRVPPQPALQCAGCRLAGTCSAVQRRGGRPRPWPVRPSGARSGHQCVCAVHDGDKLAHCMSAHQPVALAQDAAGCCARCPPDQPIVARSNIPVRSRSGAP